MLETIIAAIHIDGGLDPAREFILKVFGPMIERADAEQAQGNYKSLLQQYAQEQFNAAPSYMLLDEPFAGIDPIAVNDIRALVRHLTQRGIGVLITDHNVRETLDLVGRAYIIHDGSVLTHGTTHEIVNNEDVRRVYLGDEFKI